MAYPTRRDWLFSIKTFAAAMLALYLALLFQLPRPYWAMASVYIVSNPFVGATRSKGLYRALGTILGAAAAIFFVPPLVDTPLLLTTVIALWTGSLLYLSLTDRTARSYVFMLAGYTLPLIAFPVVNDPATVFDVAIARAEEILLGITCASIINSVVLPNALGPALAERTASWFSDASRYVQETIKGRIFGKDLSASRQGLATSVNGLEFLLSQLSYDDTHPDIMKHAQALRGRMSLLLPMASALSDPLRYLQAHDAITPVLQTLLNDITAWANSTDGTTRDRLADEFRLRLDQLEPRTIKIDTDTDTAADTAAGRAPDTPLSPSDAQSDAGSMSAAAATNSANTANAAEKTPAAVASTAGATIGTDPYDNPHWDRALLSSLLWRLRMFIDLWQDCRTLREAIDKGGRASWRPQLRHWRLGGVARHFDRGMMFFSVIPAVGATLCATALWIFTGWADGAPAVTLAAVSCSFFASLDQPAPAVFKFFIFTAVSVALSGVYLFVVLPNAHDFPMLILMFAVPFILVGTLIPQPRFTLGTMLVSVNTATFIGIQGTYDANFTTFLNGNIAGCAGLLFAFLWTRLMRPFGAEVAIGRLTRAGWADVVTAASPHAIAAQNNMASRMLDRLMQLLPRLSASDDDQHPSVASFQDLRVGLNALDLQQIRRTLNEELRLPIDRVLAGVREHFEYCIARKERVPAPTELAQWIDAALASDPEARGASHALVGLRLSLFPSATERMNQDKVNR